MCADMLAKDGFVAHAGASSYLDHLARTRSANYNEFDRAFAADNCLMTQAAEFADTPTDTLLWHMDGKFSYLFKWLADRYLAQPDSVLDCEGVHAAL